MPGSQFTLDLALVLLAALGGGLLAHLLRQPLFLGYILGGALIEPLTPGLEVSNLHLIEQLAEIGVVLLMFTLGLEFSLRELMRVRISAIGGGLVGIAAMIAVLIAIKGIFGLSLLEALMIGAAISVSSTMVIGKLLAERGELDTEHGRLMIATLLVEDLAVVVMLAIMPALGPSQGFSAGGLIGLAFALLKAAAILIPVLFLATRAVPMLIERVARTRDFELFLLVTLVLGLGTGVVAAQLGLSPAMGAFLAGLIISESDFVHETLARVLPLRDVFVALFFVSIGMIIDPTAILDNLPLHALVVVIVVAGKGLMRGALAALFRYPLRTAFIMALGFTQIGEFTFVLGRVGVDEGLISADHYNVLLASSLVTIFVSSFLFRLTPRLWHALSARFPRRTALEEAATPGSRPRAGRGHAIVCGYGRIGGAIGKALERFDVPCTVIELDSSTVAQLKERGTHVIYGDAASEAVCRAAHPETASIAVIALPDFFHARQAFRNLKHLSPNLPILVRAHWGREREELFREGVTEAIQPEFEGSIEMIRHALVTLGVPAMEMESYLSELRQRRYSNLLREWLQREDLAHKTQKLQEIRIEQGSPFASRTLRECRLRERTGVSVIEIRRTDGRLVSNPSPEETLSPGDRVLVMGAPTQLIEFIEMNRPPGSDQP